MIPPIYSHTLIRNGEPLTKLIFKNILPFVDKCLVTISERSDDDTLASLQDLQSVYRDKMVIDTENTQIPAQLTQVRQKMLDATPKDTWVLFLDDDDYWSVEQLKEMKNLLKRNEDVDGYSLNPYQVIDKTRYDHSWRNKYFLKWFKNQDGIHYKGAWPRDLVYKGDELLYWRKNPRVPRLLTRYFHLSYIKRWSFRREPWAKEYAMAVGRIAPYPKELQKELTKIFKYVKQ